MRMMEIGLRPVDGSGQFSALVASTNHTFANAVPNGVSNFSICLSPNATPYMAWVRVSAAGTAAAQGSDYAISSMDGSHVLRCSPGDQISVFASAAGNCSLCWMSA